MSRAAVLLTLAMVGVAAAAVVRGGSSGGAGESVASTTGIGAPSPSATPPPSTSTTPVVAIAVSCIAALVLFIALCVKEGRGDSGTWAAGPGVSRAPSSSLPTSSDHFSGVVPPRDRDPTSLRTPLLDAAVVPGESTHPSTSPGPPAHLAVHAAPAPLPAHGGAGEAQLAPQATAAPAPAPAQPRTVPRVYIADGAGAVTAALEVRKGSASTSSRHTNYTEGGSVRTIVVPASILPKVVAPGASAARTAAELGHGGASAGGGASGAAGDDQGVAAGVGVEVTDTSAWSAEDAHGDHGRPSAVSSSSESEDEGEDEGEGGRDNFDHGVDLPLHEGGEGDLDSVRLSCTHCRFTDVEPGTEFCPQCGHHIIDLRAFTRRIESSVSSMPDY